MLFISCCIKWIKFLELHLPSIGGPQEAENYLPFQNLRIQHLRSINYQYDNLWKWKLNGLHYKSTYLYLGLIGNKYLYFSNSIPSVCNPAHWKQSHWVWKGTEFDAFWKQSEGNQVRNQSSLGEGVRSISILMEVIKHPCKLSMDSYREQGIENKGEWVKNLFIPLLFNSRYIDEEDWIFSCKIFMTILQGCNKPNNREGNYFSISWLNFEELHTVQNNFSVEERQAYQTLIPP